MPPTTHSIPSILADVEIESYPFISYPSLEDFMAKLDDEEPRRCWIETFYRPLVSMGVKHLDDMEIVSPESLFVFHKLCPLMIMDFFVHVVETIDAIHETRYFEVEEYQNGRAQGGRLTCLARHTNITLAVMCKVIKPASSSSVPSDSSLGDEGIEGLHVRSSSRGDWK
ncbi:hypothetical protein BV22DRAFT_1134063 [Leucogyrophana mollusca]|uniref:Uncharacterized protein n=1 Tax=Leucogyrophana mollusca TaxID=85980 RepID=A0ACB8B0N5_9AGAM|nr:hypothetical protein BV22DRAFT_1134063 [Leucogyrophana mollusca]